MWRFMKPYMRDYRVGEVRTRPFRLSRAVAASSAFPPVLSPVEMRLDPDTFTPKSGRDLQRPPFTTRVILTDGGVYDNLGLETAWKRYGHDPGQRRRRQVPAGRRSRRATGLRHSYRVLDLVDNQVRSLRKRQVIGSFEEEPMPSSQGRLLGHPHQHHEYGLADNALTVRSIAHSSWRRRQPGSSGWTTSCRSG